MKAAFFSAIVLVLAVVASVRSDYAPTWDSLDSRPIPSWYDDAKFGIFIHWGVYSVPAWSPVGTYAEWYWYNLENDSTGEFQAFHNKTYGPNFKYQDFAPMFKAELFDPDQWADIIANSGARYVVPTSKHHEGFTNWPSAVSWNWNSVDIGPHRDIMGDLMTAFRKRGLHAGMYYSLFEFYHPLFIGPNPQQYVDEVMFPQMYDLINNYQPEIFWTDGEWMENSTFWKSTEFLAWLFNNSTVKGTIVINDRWGSETRGVHGGFYTPEYDATVYLNHKWEENSGLDVHSFGYNRMTPAQLYQSSQSVLNLLFRCVCNGGNLLLDIGPSADGRIPEIMQDRLKQVGSWLAYYGEAIYETRMFRVQSEVVFPFKYNDAHQIPTFTTQPVSDVVKGQVTVAGQNTSSVIPLGSNIGSASECQALCSKNSTCLSYTWYDRNTADGFALWCYGRLDEDDEYWTKPGAFSGRKDHYTVSYTFKNSSNSVFAIVSPFPQGSLYLPSIKYTQSTQVHVVGDPETSFDWTPFSPSSDQFIVVSIPSKYHFYNSPGVDAVALRLTNVN